MKRHATALIASLGVSLLSGCDLAPVYEPPHFILPESYQGSGPFGLRIRTRRSHHGGTGGRCSATSS